MISETEFQIRAHTVPRIYRYGDECIVLRFGMDSRILIFPDKERGITLAQIEEALARPEEVAREVEKHQE